MTLRIPRSRALLPFVALSALAVLSVAPAARGQAMLADKTTVVVTDLGLFRVEEGQLAEQVAGPTAFGGATVLTAPAITWLPGTDLFLVTQGDGNGTGGLWRVRVPAVGGAVVEDITPSPALGFGKDFADTDYSVGLDALFVLEDTLGRILVLGDPAHRHGDELAEWGTYPALTGNSIAVNGAKAADFGVIVSLRTGPILRITKHGTTTLYPGPSVFAQVAANPVTGEWYAMHQGEDLIGILGGSFILNMNVSGLCSKLVNKPVDIVWDPIARRIVTMGEQELSLCAFGALPVGPNHIVRLPLTAGGGPPSNQPVLLSFVGPSDVQGEKGDIAHVRLGGSDLTFHGSPGTAGDGLSPEWVAGGYGSVLATGATAGVAAQDAPASAAAWLVLGFTAASQPYQGQVLLPTPHIVVPLATDAAGGISVAVDVPAAPELLGLKVYGQWWFDDTTTPAPGDRVSTRGAIWTIGVK